MATLNKFFRILSRFNYSDITTKFSTKEVLGPASRIQNDIKEHLSQFSMSLVTPVGKHIFVTSTGRNASRELAEREAVKHAINFLSKHCFDNGIRHLNNGCQFNPVFEEANQKRNVSSSGNCFVKELPFFNEDCALPSNAANDVLHAASRSVLNYHSNFPNLNSRRYYSRQLPSSDLQAVSGNRAASLKRIEPDKNVAQKRSDFEISHAETLKKFPVPKNFIGNLYCNIQTYLKSEHPLKSHKIEMTSSREWLYSLKVSWPENAEFKGLASTKKEAGQRAAVLCIEWLQKLGKVNDKGQLMMVDKSVLVRETKKPLAELKINDCFIASAEELIADFTDSKLEEKLKKELVEWAKKDVELWPDFSKDGIINKIISKSSLIKRNRDLYNRLNSRQTKASVTRLPISNYHDQISEMIRENQVLIVKGEPGCGKSTQLPQIIMDDCTENMRATDCNIVVTQPRRISAITLAERIASERQEVVGDVVGYHVRLDSKLPRRGYGTILFCSTGVMLRKLLSNPDMDGISHVIIDEAHERDLNTDFMLLLTKRAAAKNPNLKVIIMSATINPELFEKYFSNSATLHIPGFTYPVTSYFLDDNIFHITGLKPSKGGNPQFPVVNVNAVVRLVSWIHNMKPPGAVLVFLPGWAEISKLRNEFSDSPLRNQLHVLPIHSRLPFIDQKRIFSAPPPGMRKVILATNIAETSITIDDVKYVIDAGAHKEERLNLKQGTLAIDNQWVSQASARQRRGRAGRVGPGECYHLYTKEDYESFDKFPMPEVHRIRLESSVLNSKVYSGNEKAEEFLKQLPEPPSTEMIRNAVQKLQWAGALDEDENLTPLGTRISIFTTHPFISKALVHSYFFKCVNPLVTIGTILSSDVELFPGTMGEKTKVRESKKKLSSCSDHMALTLLYRNWENESGITVNGYRNVRNRQRDVDSHVSEDALRLVGRLQSLIGEHLYQCGLVDDLNEFKFSDSDCNRYSDNSELLKGVLLSGIGNILVAKNVDIQKGILKKKNVVLTETGQKASLSSESVNHKRSTFPSPFMTYFTEVRSEQQRTVTIRETSIISPLTLILFQCATLAVNKYNDEASDQNPVPGQVIISLSINKKTLNVVSDERTAQVIIKLRRIIWSIIGYLIREKGHSLNMELFNEVTDFHERILSLLDKMLTEQSAFMNKKEIEATRETERYF